MVGAVLGAGAGAGAGASDDEPPPQADNKKTINTRGVNLIKIQFHLMITCRV